MDDFIDYYKILEIDKNSSQLEIRQKYLILAFKYHPDKNINLSQVYAKNFILLKNPNSDINNDSDNNFPLDYREM